MLSILILTKNEEKDLPGCLKTIEWCDDIVVYDSFSDDKTVEIAKAAGAKVVQRSFDNWAAHQNWGLTNISFKYPWILYIDADERISDGLFDVINSFDFANTTAAALEIQRRDFAWNGVWLKHAQISPFYIRIFRPEKMHYERLVNPVSIVEGTVTRIKGFLDHYPFSKGVQFWLSRHINYANMEALMRVTEMEKSSNFSLIKALFNRDFSVRRYHQKGIFNKIPGRPFIKWCYMIFWRRAFLDGRAGITYATLQAIYEYFIVLKTRELLKKVPLKEKLINKLSYPAS